MFECADGVFLCIIIGAACAAVSLECSSLSFSRFEREAGNSYLWFVIGEAFDASHSPDVYLCGKQYGNGNQTREADDDAKPPIAIAFHSPRLSLSQLYKFINSNY